MEVCASIQQTVARYAFPSHQKDTRFLLADTIQLLGHFEHLHVGQLSHASFADSRTLITCGTDCTISLWTVTASSRAVDLQPIGSLFGHRAPVTVLAVSRSFSALLSTSTDGHIMLWDLNRRGFVRTLPGDGIVDVSLFSQSVLFSY
jgi:WD40 repeat protein